MPSNLNIDLLLLTTKAQKNIDNLTKSSKSADKSLNNINEKIKKINTNTKKAQASSNKFNSSLSDIAKIGGGAAFGGFIILGLLRIGRLLVDAIAEFTRFEKGLIGVGKTADIAGDDLAKLGKDIREMDITASNDELLALAKTAGQLGITGSRNILKFTKVMAKLESATDVAGEAGASSIARILNVTKTAITDIDKFGSALVSLGNTSAATESEILEVATRVAQSTAIFDVAAQDTLAFGAALKSLGVRAEAGGSSIGKAFKAIDNAIVKGGKTLDKFADVIGVTSEQLTSSFRQDKTKVVLQFLEGLSKKGDDTNKTLNSLGLTDIRVSSTLGVLAKNMDVVNRSFETANRSMSENTSLNEEYGRTLESIDAKQKLFSRSISRLSNDITDSLAPAFKLALEAGTKFVDFLQFKPFEGLFQEPVALDVSKLNIDKLTDEYFKAKGEIDKVHASIKDLNKILLISPGVKKGRLADLNTQLRFAQNNLDMVNDRLEKLNKFQSLKAVADPTQAQADSDAIIEIDEKTQKLLDESRLKAQTQKEAIRLFDTESEQIFQDERLIKLQEFFTREQEATLQASLNLAQTEADKQILINGIIAKGLQNQLKMKANADKVEAKLEKQKSNKLLKDKATFFNQSSMLMRSESKELFAIGKGVALARAGMELKTSIMSSYNYGASIGGPALGTTFGLIAAAAQAANLKSIASQQPSGFEHGGFVGGSQFTGDNVNVNVNSGEAILNAKQQKNFMQLANGSGSGPREIVIRNVIELDGQMITESVSRHVADGFELGEIV